MCNKRYCSRKCIQLTDNDTLTQEQYSAVSRLIFETDPYIYPAMFGEGSGGIQNVVAILPSVFELKNDAMFTKKNLFVLYNNEDIIGLILWCDNNLEWNIESLLEIANESGIELNKGNIELVRKEYVDSRYLDGNQDHNHVSIINVCVDSNYRGTGVGKYMLNCFIKEHPQETLELAVLANNTPAIKLYQKFGFKVYKEVDGFSLIKEKPKCLIMKRKMTYMANFYVEK